MTDIPFYNDLETYSPVPINYGTHAYAEQAEIMLWAYAYGDDPWKVWDITDGSEMPEDLAMGLLDDAQMTVWHNGGNFDRTVIRHALKKLAGRIPKQLEKFDMPARRIHDTMVQALTHGLPGGLGPLCKILNISEEESKDKRGKQLINLFCKPRPKSQKLRRATRDTHPKEWAEFIEYAGRDIPAMRAIHRKMPMWNYRGKERALWELDQRINDRGIRIDLDLAHAAIATVARAQADLSEYTQLLTDGAVEKTTQRDRLLKHILAEHGVDLPDLQASTLERRINDQNLPWAVRELLAIRMQASTTSTTKYKALINMVSSDGFLRGTTQFCGASRTGRWAGRGFQIQNLPSKGLPPADEVAEGIEAIIAGAADILYRDVMKMVSAAIRGCLIARQGKKIVVSDLSNIEGRFAAWLACEEWKLQAFRDFDAGTGDDLYKLSYAKAFRCSTADVTKYQRQIGKVMELALGYEGGVGAFITFSLVYNIDLDDMAVVAWPSIPEWALQEAQKAWKWAEKRKATFGLAKETYMACDALKRLWRAAHPEISSYWPELQDAAREAIANPGRTVVARKLKFRRDGAWLRMILPSGRAVCYAAPRVDEKGRISYLGVNSYTRRWQRTYTYGGKLFENACQSGGRDVMAENMPAMEVAGYDILTTVHDEGVTEADDNQGFSARHLSEILATNPSWAPDLPLAAGGFEGYRYRKD